MPTHQDSQGDALNTIMNLLLDIPSAEARHAYINSAILCVGNSGGTKNMGMLGRILREERLFNAVFRLFRFDHFRHRENPKVPGLSIRAIYGWFPKRVGVSRLAIDSITARSTCFLLQLMTFLLNQCADILEFLAAPVEFQEIDTADADAALDAFIAQYNRVKPKLAKPISASVRRLLDNSYFPSWTTAYTKHMVTAFRSKDKKCPLAMEYFGTDIQVEEAAYMKKLKDFWKAVRTHAKDELNIIATLSRAADVVKRSMPGKLQALECGLFDAIYPQRLFKFFPVPTKEFVNSLHKETEAIDRAIHEVSLLIDRRRSTRDMALTKQCRSFNGSNPCLWLL